MGSEMCIRDSSWVTGSSAVQLAFTASLGSVTGTCGERVPSVAGDAVAVHLAVSGVPAGSVATLKGPAQATYGAAAADASGSLVLDGLVPGGTAFVRAEVRRDAQPTSAMVALTNPIFLS